LICELGQGQVLTPQMKEDMQKDVHVTPTDPFTSYFGLDCDVLEPVGIDLASPVTQLTMMDPKEFRIYFQMQCVCDLECVLFRHRVKDNGNVDFNVKIDYKNRMIYYKRDREREVEKVNYIGFLISNDLTKDIIKNLDKQAYVDLEFVF
jgi:hypothetical protein